jgi:hypothetical protein
MHQYCSPMSEQQSKPKCCPSSVVVFCCCCVAGMTATQGPTLAGCKVTSKTELTLHFNQSLLGTELLLTRPQTPQAEWYKSVNAQHQSKLKTDSAGMYACSPGLVPCLFVCNLFLRSIVTILSLVSPVCTLMTSFLETVLMVCSTPPADPENPTADLGNASTCQVYMTCARFLGVWVPGKKTHSLAWMDPQINCIH